jgi:hypothetical protein
MSAQIVQIEKDIEVLCVTVSSFPDGVQNAFDGLSSKIPSTEGRTLYGISYGTEDGSIIYKAAITQVESDEAEKYQCETFLIRKGSYISETITDFMKNIPEIGQTFRKLFADPRVDKTSGYCVERYLNQKDVQCLVTLATVETADVTA